LMARWISAEGYAVITAQTGDEALALAAQHRPDLVVLDIMIPQPNGFDVCSALKTNQGTAHARVVLMSGLQHPENQARGREVGADAFLAKPVSGEDVRAILRWAFESVR